MSTETIPSDAALLIHLFDARSGHGTPHSDKPCARYAREAGWTEVSAEWGGLTVITLAGLKAYERLERAVWDAR